MKRLAALSSLLPLTIGLFLLARPVSAQSVTPTPVVTPPPINLDITGVSADEFTKQLAALQVTYRNQLTMYRTDEKAYQISKDQYYQIQTLAALEESVRNTRKVMLTRVDVLVTYLSIARLTLQNTKGIDTDVKTDALQQIDILTEDLKTHRKSVESATDRTTLLNMAVQFATLSPRVSVLSKRISYLVGYGNLQAVTDKMIVVKKELQENIDQTETNPLVLAEKKRGLDEVQRNLDQVNTPLLKARSALALKNSESSTFATAEFKTSFTAIYGGLSRSLSYLKELVKN